MAARGGRVLSLRRMTAADKPAVVAIAAKIWDGTDHLPAVFDDWVADPQGEFTAVLHDGRLVGCGKLSFLTPCDAWFEGLRKDPDADVKGVAAAVTAHYLEVLYGRRDLASIRFSTSVKNSASISAHEKMGFRKCLTLSCRTWTGSREELEVLSPAAPAPAAGSLAVHRLDDSEAAARFLESGGCLEATRGLLPDGWRLFPYSRDLLSSRYVQKGHCWAAFDGGEMTGVAIFLPAPNREHQYLKVVALDARGPRPAHALLDTVFSLAREQARGYNEIELIAPAATALRGVLSARGFRSGEQEEDVLVYEYPGVGA
jgi:hypothetical protein